MESLATSHSGVIHKRTVFALVFSLFSVFHYLNYVFEYGSDYFELDLLAIVVAAVALLVRPSSSVLLMILMAASLVSAIIQAPTSSNHTMVRNVAVAGYWCAFAFTLFSKSRQDNAFRGLNVAGCGALIVMYVFGIFHKINRDFLNPETSCAVALFREMPRPLSLLQGAVVDHIAIYGTFVVEGAVILALLSKRYRHLGIVVGILFHLMLATSAYAMYVSFTTLAIALHSLFLDEKAAIRIMHSPEMQWVKARLLSPVFLLPVTAMFACMIFSAYLRNYAYATFAILPLIAPFCYLVIRYGRPSDSPTTDTIRRGKPELAGFALVAVFFVNCTMPYLGLKSAQTINMFANLRLEGGVSNHLLLPNKPGPFTYLDQAAVITDPGSSPLLRWIKKSELAIVHYQLLAMLEDDKKLSVGFTLDGQAFEDVSAENFESEIDDTLHHPWVRRFFHFQPADISASESCNV